MRQGIVIVTQNKDNEALINLLYSMKGATYPVLVYTNDFQNTGFELAAIDYAYENTKWDEFLLLQDTFEIKDIKFFDLVFKEHCGKGVTLERGGMSYAIKYRREVLNKMVIPLAKSKADAVHYEGQFNNDYLRLDGGYINLFNHIPSNGTKVHLWGRENLKKENEYIIKYKSIWCWQQVYDYDRDNNMRGYIKTYHVDNKDAPNRDKNKLKVEEA